MTKKKQPEKKPANVVAFPPLRKAPAPPRGSFDRRQAQYRRVVNRLGGALGLKPMSSRDLTGYPASAVNLGALQHAMETGLARFDLKAIERRWPEVHDWLAALLRSWVQRPRYVQIDRRANGIHLTLHAQDDLGYYEYAFDVFPGR